MNETFGMQRDAATSGAGDVLYEAWKGTLDLLRDGRKLLSDERNWCQHHALHPDGRRGRRRYEGRGMDANFSRTNATGASTIPFIPMDAARCWVPSAIFFTAPKTHGRARRHSSSRARSGAAMIPTIAAGFKPTTIRTAMQTFSL